MGLPRLDRGTAKLPKLPGLVGPRNQSTFPRPTAGLPQEVQPDRSQPWRNPPADWQGSLPEWAIYWAHSVAVPLRGPEGGVWRYQFPLFGSFMPAGFVPDFSEYDLHVTIDVNEEDADRNTEVYRALILSSFRPPITHVIIDEEDALSNPVYYLNEALAGRSHSRYGALL